MLELRVKRLRPEAKLPTRAFPHDAGWDLYLPEDVNISGPGHVIPLGVAVEVPAGYFLWLRERSGTGMNGLRIAAGIIDSGYRGEVKLLADAVVRPGEPVLELVYGRGERVAQAILLPIPEVACVEVDVLSPSPRHSGGFGSTGR